MNKILISVNTYFQIIIAIQLKLTKYKDCNVDIIVSDHSMNFDIIVNNLRRTKLFNEIYCAKSRNFIHSKKLKQKIHRNILANTFPKVEINKLIYLKSQYYDEFLFYNIDNFTYLIFDVLYKKNRNLKIYRFEEGFVTYLHDDDITHKAKIIRKIFLKKSLTDKIEKLLLFNKDLIVYDTKVKIETILKLKASNIKLRDSINDVFNYKNIRDNYSQKYIFFEESFFCDNKGIDDLELILKIADIVGKENLLVKLHPRNKIDRFEKYGISTNKTIGIPWEVIQMNNDFSDKVFLTISSGSVLASRLYFNDNIKTYLLFNCTEKMSDMVTDKYFEYLDKVKIKFGLESFCIPNNKNEFFELLRKDVECERKSNK